MLPAMASKFNSGDFRNLPKPFIDVFCDQGYFTLEDTRQIFQAATKYGFPLKVHADEFANLGATRLAVEAGAASCDHLLGVSDREIDLLAGSDTIAVLLPGTCFFLNLKDHAPARKLIDRGAAVALGTDFNPGSCHIYSLPFIFGLACLNLKMTPSEALSAVTINAAHAVGRGGQIGQIKNGFFADILILDVEHLDEIAYNMTANPIHAVIKGGNLVWEKHMVANVRRSAAGV
jgi:imidazolonepropionase